MATNIKNANEDADMAECDGEKIVTMMDVLKEQEDFEEDANAVLGGSDDKNCTYSQGYIKRQAIYACLTCCSDAKTDPEKRAGVCLACSLMCHENHELIELYTKRNFRCDCGNPKFNSHPCTFTQIKTEVNDDNHYNQNFSGLYCTCNRPYPDPDATEEEIMIQCIICEDWLHSSHLDSNVPANDQYSEMVCKQCMNKNEFLHDYSELAVNTECTIEIVEVNGNDGRSVICNGDVNKSEFMDSTNDNENINSYIDIEKTESKQDANDSNKVCAEKPEKKEDERKDEINIDDSKNIKDSSLNEHSEKDSIENTEDSDLNLPTSQEADTNEKASAEEILTNSDISEDKANKENIEKPDIDNIKSGVKENNESNETKSETSTQVTATLDDKSVIDSNINENTQNGAGQISKDEELKIIENSEEEEYKNEQDIEKMEEDMLLADPVESEPESNSINLNDKETNNTDTITKENEESLETKEKTDTSDKNVEENIQNENNSDKTIQKMETTENASTDPSTISEIKENEQEDITNKEESTLKQEKPSEKRKLSIEDDMDDLETKKIKLDTQNKSCSRPQDVKKVYKGATFWPSSFRQKLCTCQKCISMYKDLSVLFLTDPDDTVTAYENLGKDIINGKPLTQYEKGLEALSSLDRIQQINALTEYNKMRDKLLDFLKSFKDRKEIVKEEDIKAFFAGMKPKREPDGVYFCREV